MVKFEYLVVHVEHDRVHTANGHWQGTVERGRPGDAESCPDLHGYLADAGAQGWELVAVDPEAEGTARLYLKRARM